MKHTLWIDSSAGISGDRAAAALIGLGIPERDMVRAIKTAAEETGLLDAHTHIEFMPDGTLAYRLHVSRLTPHAALSLDDMPAVLDRALSRTGVQGIYADFARRACDILYTAEPQNAVAARLAPEETVSLSIIGTAHTPYKHKAPYQPGPEHENEGTFYIQLAPVLSKNLVKAGFSPTRRRDSSRG